MKKSTLLLLFTALIISSSFARSEYGLSKDKELPAPGIAHSVGKRLVKGTWLLGGTFSIKSDDFSDIDLLIIDVDKLDQRAFNVRLEGSYFYKENISVGLGLQFGEDKATLGADFLNNSYRKDIRNFHRTYGVLGFIKNHIPVSSNNVFYVTNQTELSYGYRNGPSETYVGDILERKYAKKQTMGVSIRPGILIFLTDNFAFDLNMGILGFSHSVERTDYQYPPNNLPAESERKDNAKNRSTNLNLKFDLLKLGFGFSYYF